MRELIGPKHHDRRRDSLIELTQLESGNLHGSAAAAAFRNKGLVGRRKQEVTP